MRLCLRQNRLDAHQTCLAIKQLAVYRLSGEECVPHCQKRLHNLLMSLREGLRLLALIDITGCACFCKAAKRQRLSWSDRSAALCELPDSLGPPTSCRLCRSAVRDFIALMARCVSRNCNTS